MDTIVVPNTDSVAIVVNTTDKITVDNFDTVAAEVITSETVVSGATTNSITNQEIYNVVVEVRSSTTIVSGQAGPPGPTGLSEDSVAYARQIDFITDDLIYKGEAEAGSAFSSPLWRIRKIIIGTDGDVSEVWADGNSNFDNVWDDRASLTYL